MGGVTGRSVGAVPWKLKRDLETSAVVDPLLKLKPMGAGEIGVVVVVADGPKLNGAAGFGSDGVGVDGPKLKGAAGFDSVVAGGVDVTPKAKGDDGLGSVLG